MRREPISLREEQEQWLAEVTPPKVPLRMTRTIFEYYLANKPADSDWCVLPVTNVEAFLGSSALSKLYLKQLTGTVIERKEERTDACIFRMKTRTTMAVTATKKKMNHWLPFKIFNRFFAQVSYRRNAQKSIFRRASF